MRDTLFPFQEDALEELKSKIAKAHLLMDDGDPQVISFSAPTGSGKTIVMPQNRCQTRQLDSY